MIDQKEYKECFARLKKFLATEEQHEASSSRIDDTELLTNYLEVKTILGYVPGELELHKTGRLGRGIYRKRYRTYLRFLEIIGHRDQFVSRLENTMRMHEQIPEPSVIELILEFRRLKDKLGKIPTFDDIAKHSAYPVAIYKKVFVSLDALTRL